MRSCLGGGSLMILDAISRFSLPCGEVAYDSLVKGGKKPDRSLITEEPWDCYQLKSLLPLKKTHRENTEFGFLLRHYWVPATIPRFDVGSRTTFADGKVDSVELEIERKMASCRSDRPVNRPAEVMLPPVALHTTFA